MSHAASVYGALLIYSIGIAYKVWTWVGHSIGSDARQYSAATRIAAAVRGIFATLFSAKILVLTRVLIVDVLLQGRILKRDVLSWVTHLFIFGGFLSLLLMHALGRFTTAALFSDYHPTLNPYLFLRNLFGALVLLGVRRALGSKALPADSARYDRGRGDPVAGGPALRGAEDRSALRLQPSAPLGCHAVRQPVCTHKIRPAQAYRS